MLSHKMFSDGVWAQAREIGSLSSLKKCRPYRPNGKNAVHTEVCVCVAVYVCVYDIYIYMKPNLEVFTEKKQYYMFIAF